MREKQLNKTSKKTTKIIINTQIRNTINGYNNIYKKYNN